MHFGFEDMSTGDCDPEVTFLGSKARSVTPEGGIIFWGSMSDQVLPPSVVRRRSVRVPNAWYYRQIGRGKARAVAANSFWGCWNSWTRAAEKSVVFHNLSVPAMKIIVVRAFSSAMKAAPRLSMPSPPGRWTCRRRLSKNRKNSAESAQS